MSLAPRLGSRPAQVGLLVVLQGFDEGGGVATSCLNQIRILADAYRITLITNGGGAPATPVPDGVVVRRLPVAGLRWLRRLAHVPRQWVFLLAVRRVLVDPRALEGVEGVIFHSHPAAALLAAPLRRRGIRSILVMHGDIFDRPPGTYDRLLTTWYRWATPRAYRRVDAVISLSPAMERLVRRWTVGRRVPIHLVPNCIDPAAIGLPERRSLAEGTAPAAAATTGVSPSRGDRVDGAPATELLYVGRIEPLKGIDLLLQAVAALRRSGRQLRLRCVGAVSPPYRPLLERQITELGLRSIVQLCGPLPRDRLGESYRRCQLLVVPSRSEPQATVILEGMATGCAIVASDVGGNPMMVEHDRSGLLFPRDDLPSLLRCLERLLDDPAQRQRLGEEACRRFACLFSRQVVEPRLLEAVAATLACA